ncbi:acetoin utilization deacetylase AcuC-like enzyme [Desulfofundulus luciae]|uniref:Acetoin utilization deacetylase AcuC-like enzyme n=1 Tax=Desulfofundulus luciae TaxID=74702 RepID=A0ABU0B3T3_9FIRM|nr:acetoin utilization deacetylase AcuC-like enzyme [Desulfofundulus luciae]
MKVVFHERYKEVYASDPAAAAGRLDPMVEELAQSFPFVEPRPATDDDVLLVHTPGHLERVKKRPHTYEVALLAVGGAILASDLAMRGEKAFGLLRPPGHHASPDSSWGFCWFNNIAVAVERLRRRGLITRALIIDIDLHYGDGTANIFAGVPEVTYHHVEGISRERFLRDLELTCRGEFDLVAISAGFDRHEADWGRLLKTEDYEAAGKIIGTFARQKCRGRVFAVLEGGYNSDVLGKNALALLKGLEQG